MTLPNVVTKLGTCVRKSASGELVWGGEYSTSNQELNSSWLSCLYVIKTRRQLPKVLMQKKTKNKKNKKTKQKMCISNYKTFKSTNWYKTL